MNRQREEGAVQKPVDKKKSQQDVHTPPQTREENVSARFSPGKLEQAEASVG